MQCKALPPSALVYDLLLYPSMIRCRRPSHPTPPREYFPLSFPLSIYMPSPYSSIQSRMSHFAADILKLIPALREARSSRLWSIDQLVRSSLSIGSNYAEARGAESHADFVHKLHVALKEAREALHQLDVLQQMPLAPQRTVFALRGECDQFCAILYSSAVTAKRDRKGDGQRQRIIER